MPYRAELKRPDLKGQFPCSVCGKIFCHSSSLSRHRMQAHFKSYTCTQCNQEISSNETLRSHMFRVHSISRMFMCRCCNWAFPDKTSLHIHMQSMLRSGQPGEVSVLARSSTEDGMGSESPSSSPKFCTSTESLLKVANGPSASLLSTPLSSHSINSLYPQLRHDHLLSAMKKEPTSSLPMNPAQILNMWLANNPFVQGLPNPLAMHSQLLNANPSMVQTDSDMASAEDDDELDEDAYIEINNASEETDECKDDVTEDGIEVHDGEKKGGSHKRKATRPQQVSSEGGETDSIEDMATPLKMSALEEKPSPLILRDQLSPTVSDSHTSSGGSSGHHGMDSPPNKCFECHDLKLKVCETETRLRDRNMEVASLTDTVDKLQKQILLLVQVCKRNEMQMLQASQLAFLRPSPAVHLPSTSVPSFPQMPSAEGIKRIFDQLVQNSLSNQRC